MMEDRTFTLIAGTTNVDELVKSRQKHYLSFWAKRRIW